MRGAQATKQSKGKFSMTEASALDCFAALAMTARRAGPHPRFARPLPDRMSAVADMRLFLSKSPTGDFERGRGDRAQSLQPTDVEREARAQMQGPSLPSGEGAERLRREAGGV